MSARGQTINDRLNAAKYTLAGQALARCICKATTEELIRPKRKHLDYLAVCTYESNVSMQQMTTLIIERTNHSNWIVIYKALITVHHLMSQGSERFTQYLASSNHTFQLVNFVTPNEDIGAKKHTFIRRYSNYINQKSLSYRTLATDLCRTRKSDDSLMKKIPFERLIETLAVIQKQLDTLFDFECKEEDLHNDIILASFNLLFDDAIRLFASYNNGIINLIEKYFDLNKKMCREAFEAYKQFLRCADRAMEFLKIAEKINSTNGELPDIKRAPYSLLDAFEQHLLSLESNKKRTDSKQTDDQAKNVDPFKVPIDQDNVKSSRPALSQGVSRDEIEAQLAFATGDMNFFEAATNNDASGDEKAIQLDTSKPDNLVGVPKVENDAFDSQPPGFSDGSLLVPEPQLQLSFHPLIDPRTQQQLIQIKREQVANKYVNNNNNQSSRSANSGLNKSKKSNRESMFEDLEKTMRRALDQSLTTKAENQTMGTT